MFKKMIMFILVLILSLALAAPALGAPLSAPTSIPGGEVSGVWDLAGSPYLIDGDITVPTGATLTIQPGVEVLFQSWYSLTVNGVLLAEGTENAPVLFGGGHSTAGWLGIRFMNAPDGSRLTYAIIENGRATGTDPLNKGGGLYIDNASPTIRYSTIRNNHAKYGGGGIYLNASNAILEANTIEGNTSGEGSASAIGGGLAILYSDPVVSGNIIRGNSVSIGGSYSTPSGYGGGLFVRSSNATFSGNLIADNHVFAHLNSNARGGGLYLYYGAPIFINNTITGNSLENESTGVYALREGGGIYTYWSNPTFVNTILWNDSPQEVYLKNNSATFAYSDVQGGQAGVIADNATVNWEAGNISLDPGFIDAAAGDFTLASNSPAIDAGAAFFEWNGAVLVDLSPEDYNGTAPDMGAFEFGGGGAPNQPPVAVAAVSPDHGSAPLTVQFTSTGSYDPDGTISAVAWEFGDGGASNEPNPSHTYTTVGIYQALLTVTDDRGAAHSAVVTVNVQDGTTVYPGAVSGIWLASGSPYRIEGDITIPAGETLTIEPGVVVSFQNWYKLTVNGTLLASGTSAEPILFTSADGSPGWVGIRFVDAPDGSLLDGVIVEKGRASGASPYDSGGGIYIRNASPTIRNSVIRDNYAKSSGGGIYLESSNAVLEGNTIANNQAGQGGSAYGGGIYMTNANAQLTGNVIRDNFVLIAGSYTTPYGLGGGIYAANSNSTLRGNLIHGNAVQGSNNRYARGGALYLQNANLDLIGNTITGNTVGSGGTAYIILEGGGVYVSQSTLTVVNSILWNDTPEEVFVLDSGPASTITVAYSDVAGGEAGVATNNNASLNWQAGNITSDPRFTDAANADFTLQADSPAVDAGIAFFEWESRVLVDLSPAEYNGNAPDMGAFESSYSGGGSNPPNELHVQAQTVSRQQGSRRYYRGVDTILITDQNNQPVAGVLVTVSYDGPNQGQVSGVTGADGTITLYTNWKRKPNGTWCFSVIDVVLDGYSYNPAANVITVQCE